MDSHFLARTGLTIFCGVQGLATIALDLNRTHAAHPQWLGHARFHVVWQAGTTTALAVLECVLLWCNGPFEADRFYVAALLAVAPIFGFFAALATRRLYGGTLSDPGGIPPVLLTLRRRQVRIDMNLLAELAGIVAVVAMVALYRSGNAAR